MYNIIYIYILCTRPYMTIQCNIKVPKHNYSKIRGSLHSGMPTVQLSRIVLRYSRCLICVWEIEEHTFWPDQQCFVWTICRYRFDVPPGYYSVMLMACALLILTYFSLIFEVSGPDSWCLSCQDCLIACRYDPTHPWASCPWVKSQQRQSYDW